MMPIGGCACRVVSFDCVIDSAHGMCALQDRKAIRFDSRAAGPAASLCGTGCACHTSLALQRFDSHRYPLTCSRFNAGSRLRPWVSACASAPKRLPGSDTRSRDFAAAYRTPPFSASGGVILQAVNMLRTIAAIGGPVPSHRGQLNGPPRRERLASTADASLQA
jgi:hypothetical protein